MTPQQPSSVLIVDDEAGIRTALRLHFARNGWTVETAAGVREASRLLESRNFQLVVSDMRMPDGDGLDVIWMARSVSPATPVILLTAYGTVPDAVEAMRCGACDYLTKPVSFPKLEEAAARVMQQARPACVSAQPVSLSVSEAEPSASVPGPTTPFGPVAAGVPIRDLERAHLENTLAMTQGNRTQAAELLGISVRTVRNRIREYGLPPRRYA